MKHLGLFEGIGGFSLAARWMDWETLAWCEWNPFGQKVLRHHFPEAEGFGDITKTDFTKYANRIDILTGGFPCQPYSQAGKRKGKEDERHLWPEMLRAIREIQPGWIVGENVPGLLNWNRGLVLDEIKADLEGEGFEVFPSCILPACAVNAPHRRDRVWIVAYSQSNRDRRKLHGMESENGSEWEPEECRENDLQYRNNGEKWYATNTGSEQLQERTQDNIRENRKEDGTGMDNRSERFGNVGDATNTDSNGRDRGNSEHEKYASEGRQYAQRNIERMGEYAPNTSNQGLQGGKVNGSIGSIGSSRTQRNEQSTGLLQPTWENFPTQPPLCNGNDGLPARLDGITFPKWRNESIKAGGNAIVPQVAFEIFKAIEQTEFFLLQNVKENQSKP